MDDFVVNVVNLRKSFAEVVAVNEVSIQLERGKIYGFLGPNGSGKTTTMRMLCGLLTPDSGNGSCLGYDLYTQGMEIKNRIGYMTQKFGLYDDLTIRENLEFIARMYKLPVQVTTKKILEDLELTNRQYQLAGTLSGGWKQRLALASCIMHEPQLLLLDEPTAGVDPMARRKFWNEIHELAHRGVTILVSTHYMDEAERCHEIAYIFGGKILAKGTINNVMRAANITVWRVPNNNNLILKNLQTNSAIEQVYPFGDSLHLVFYKRTVILSDVIALVNMPELTIEAIEPSLEDVFINLAYRVEFI